MIVFDLHLRAAATRSRAGSPPGEEFDRQKAGRTGVAARSATARDVERRPSAKVRVAKARSGPRRRPPPRSGDAIAGMPPELLAKLREVVRNTEDVGERFPEEARKIHYDEAPARSIRGKASREEAEALTEEGIDFSQLPPIPHARYRTEHSGAATASTHAFSRPAAASRRARRIFRDPDFGYNPPSFVAGR